MAIARQLAIPHGLGLALRHNAAAARFVGRYGVAATADLFALARRARLRTPTPEVSVPTASSVEQPFGLTAREREVLTPIVGGFSNSEIGSRLSVSDSTASVQVAHILSKLGVTTRVEAAAIAIRSGLDS